jgi:hypothetical protein
MVKWFNDYWLFLSSYAPPKIKAFSFGFFFSLAFYPSHLFGVVETFNLVEVDGDTLTLSHSYILAESDEVFLNGDPLARDEDYSIDYDRGILVIESILHPDSTIPHPELQIHYDFFPFSLQESYFHRKLLPLTYKPPEADPSINNPESRILNPESRFSPPTPSTLFLSGSKSVGISFGSEQSLSLDQSLRVNINGKVEDVEVNAVLSDENTPLQPEGTTESLEDLDEVLVEIKGKSLSATLGDFNLSLGESQFGRVDRRLQGGMVSGMIGTTGPDQADQSSVLGSFLLSGARSRGKFATNRFYGVEGRQGPYPLVGRDGEIDIVVIAGSEKVFLDEILLTRGERNGYTIDYSLGELTFTPRHLITFRSRIVVEFEYTTEEFRRNLIGGRGASQFTLDLIQGHNSKFTFGTTFFREGDSSDSPLGFSLSDEDRVVLSNAGDDTSKAWVSGATFVGPGLGDYIMKGDTFEFAGYKGGDYLVTFTDVGEGLGEYEFVINGYQYVGTGNGRYTPFIRLPLPSRKSFIALDLLGEVREGVQIKGEVAGSERDINLLSDLDDGDNLGKAGTFTLELKPEAGLFPKSLGKLGFRGKVRSVDDRFEFPGRGRNLQFEDRWNVKERTGREDLGEIFLSYSPVDAVNLFGDVGRLERKSETHVLEGIGGKWRPGNLPSLAYQVERIRRSERDSSRIRQTFKTDYSVWKLKPQFTFFREDSSSYRFRDWRARLDGGAWGSVTGFLGGSLQKEEQGGSPYSTAKTAQMGVLLNRWKSLSGGLDFSHREKEFTGAPGEDVKFNLASLRFNVHPIVESRVEVTSTQNRLNEERFIQVNEGDGDYSLDTLTGVYFLDPDGNFRKEILPLGDFEPVHRLETSLRFDYSPEPRLRLEGYGSLEEERKDSRLWDITDFQDDETTLRGMTDFEGDVTLYPEKMYSLRFRFRRTDDEDNQFQNLHKEGIRTERSIRLRSRALEKTVWTFDFALIRDEESSTELGEERVINEKDFTGEITYRPTPQWEPSFQLGYKIEDVEELFYGASEITSISASPGLRYHLLKSGRVSTRMKFTDRQSDSSGLPPDFLVFSPIGFTTEAFVDIDYRLNEYLTARVSYTGRWEPDRDALNTASAELRAFF